MTRHNFREVQHRFGHIDARVIRVDVSIRPTEDVATTRIVLDLYPWWEHPLFVAAREAGTSWGFDSASDEGVREMTITAIEPVSCDVKSGLSATDISFAVEHPVLWDFEDTAQILCNTDFETRELIERILERRIPNITQGVLLRHIPAWSRENAPYSLGYFPFTLFHLVRAELELMRVKTFVPREPELRDPLVALFVDDGLTVVAKDFFLEVPEFEHRPEWFRSR